MSFRATAARAIPVIAFALLGVPLAIVLSRPSFAPGKTAPDFSAVDQDGKTFKLSDYRGKVVVLDFWGFW